VSLITSARSANLQDLHDLLINQHGRKLDIVAPAHKLQFRDANLVLTGVDPVMDARGVTIADGTYRPTSVFDEGIADKLSIPLAYVRRLRAERPDLYDANANGWLRGKYRRSGPGEPLVPVYPGDKRNFLLRTFTGDDAQGGVARAILSDRFAVMDNLDALTAALDGISQAGVRVEIDGCDLTDRRMYVRVKAPTVQAYARDLLKGYRSPFTGETGEQNPTVFAGFVVSNSETGDGAFSIAPRLIVQVCSNGMTIQKDAMKAVHLGAKMDEGAIRWSRDTVEKNLAVVTARARDAVATFLDVDYMQKVIRDMSAKAGKEIEGNVQEHITVVTKKLGFDQEQQDAVFAMFIKGAQLTSGGVMQAVTAAAQEVTDADKAFEMEAKAFLALDLSAAAA
jgi:hypothetical protein